MTRKKQTQKREKIGGKERIVVTELSKYQIASYEGNLGCLVTHHIQGWAILQPNHRDREYAPQRTVSEVWMKLVL